MSNLLSAVKRNTEGDDDDLTANERLILSAFDSATTLDHAALLAATGLSIGELAMEMMELELKGRIRALPGKRYEKV